MGGICRLLIKAYSDNSFTSEKGEYTSTINPTNLKISSNVSYSNFYSFGNNNLLRYNHSEPRIMSFSLLLDNTGIFPNSNIEVKTQLNSLESLLEGYQKDINEPYYVRVIWGTIDFKGKLNKLFINYSYIKEGGDILRAQVDLEIIEQVLDLSKPTSQKEVKNDKQSDSSKNKDSESHSNSAGNKSNSDVAGKQAANNVTSEDVNKDTDDNAENNKNNPNDQKDKNIGEEQNIEEKQNLENNNLDENNQTDNKKSSDENKTNDEENNDKGTDATNNEYGPNAAESSSKQIMVKAGDSLPSLISEGLKSMGMSLKNIGEIIKSAVCKFAAFNLLDTIRKLIKGVIAKIPNLVTLIKQLIKKAKEVAKKGVTFVKKKTNVAKNKVQSGVYRLRR